MVFTDPLGMPSLPGDLQMMLPGLMAQLPELPQMAPPPPVPYLTEEMLRAYATQDKSQWSERNKRILRHRRLFELEKPTEDKLKAGQIATVTNDAKVIVRKIASMIATHPGGIEVPARDPQKVKEAERVEQFLQWFWDEIEDRAGDGLHGSRKYEEAEYITRDGMVVDMTTWDPEHPEFPWKSQLLDPMTVYPTYHDDILDRITLVYNATWGDVKRMLPAGKDAKLREAFPDMYGPDGGKSDWKPVTVTKVFCQEQGQWDLGVDVGGTVALIEVFGYNPFTITYAAGRSYDLQADGDHTGIKALENVGVGVFDLLEEPLINKNEDYSLLREAMHRDLNPPKVAYTNDEGKLTELDLEPGKTYHLWQDDKFQLVQVAPDTRKLEAIVTMDQQQISRGSMPDGLWGEKGGNTGVQEYMILGNAQDQVHVYVTAMARHYSRWFRHILALYREHGTQPVEFTQTVGTITLAGQAFSLQDIEALAPSGGAPVVKVVYSQITPQNEASKAQIAVNLAREKILDLRSAREIGLPAPYNQMPEQIGQQVLADIALTHPSMTQLLSMRSAMTAPDPLMRQLANMMFPFLMQQLQQSMLPGGAPGAPGPGHAPAPGGAPGSDKQMSPEANPPELGQNEGLPGSQAATPPPGSQPVM